MKIVKAYMKLGAQTGEETHYVYYRVDGEGTDEELIKSAISDPDFQSILVNYFKVEGV